MDFQKRITFEEALPIIQKLKELSLTIATAESCTGGLLAHCLTNVPGASQVFKVGLVTYSNESKSRLLGIPQEITEEYGAVSAEVAQRMAEGICQRGGVTFGLATTGFAGPEGGSVDKPVGTVFLAIAQEGKKTEVWREFFPGDRLDFKEKAVEALFERLKSRVV